MNALKITVLMLALMAVFMTVGYFLGGQRGVMIAFGFAVAMNFFSYWYSDKVVLTMYRAKPVTENDNSRLYRIVRDVSTRANLPMPKVYVVPTRTANAFATGRNAEHAAVAATEGIMELLNDRELEGVIGHEMAHIKHKDMLIGTIAATFAGAISMLAFMARWAAIFGGGGGREDSRGGGLGLIFVAILAPIAAMVIQMAISRQREYQADAEGARITNRPLELAEALRKLHSTPVKMNLDSRPATAHLMIANPLSGKRLSSLFSTHPPVEERIKRLKDIAYHVA